MVAPHFSVGFKKVTQIENAVRHEKHVAPHFNVGFKNGIPIEKCRRHGSQSPVPLFNMSLYSFQKKCRWGKPTPAS